MKTARAFLKYRRIVKKDIPTDEVWVQANKVVDKYMPKVYSDRIVLFMSERRAGFSSGNYGAASIFVVLITFAAPVNTMLFPAFSKLDPQRDHETLKNVFQFSIKYASLLVVLAEAIVMALAIDRDR